MEVLKERTDIQAFVKSVAEEQGIYDHQVVDVKTNQKGEGYLGQIFMVTVKDKSNGRRLEIVVKAAFIDEKIRTMAPIRRSFENEIYFYTHVYPAYHKFEREKGVSQIIDFVPKCLQICIKEQQEMLALENLKTSGFEIFDKKLALDEDHIKLIFQTYGRIHGFSFALQDQKPQEFEKLTSGFCNIYEEFMRNDMFCKHMAEQSKAVQDLLIPGEDDVIIKKFQKYYGNKINEVFEDVVTKKIDYSAILHGDCWSNNMMFKYENTPTGRKPVDIRLIDFQLIKLGSPVCDLSYFLYSGASKTSLDNLNEYLELYYKSFSSCVRKLGSDPDKVFPFSALKDHWKQYASFGMIMAFAILRMKMTEKDDLVDLTDEGEVEDLLEKFNNARFDQDGFNKRTRALLWHMSEIDAL